MKAVILAAGVGSRLAPLTDDQPKAMVAVNGKPLLLHQIEAIRAAGVPAEDIVVVTGHAADAVQRVLPAGVRTIHNPEFATKNSIYTFSLLRNIVATDDIVLLHCDVFFPPVLLKQFLIRAQQEPRASRLLVDAGKPLAEEEMKVQYRSGVLVRLAKTLRPDRCDGEYTGIAFLRREDLGLIMQKVDAMLQAGQTQVWYDNAVEAAAQELDIKGHFFKDVPWIEIDTHEDLGRARDMLPAVDEYQQRKLEELRQKELIERQLAEGTHVPGNVVKKADGWYPVLFSDPIAIPLTKYVAKNMPWVTPNQLTAGAIIGAVIAAGFFYWGTPAGLIIGAILFKICFILDGMDGKLARLTNRVSDYSGFYDMYFDQVRTVGCLAALCLGQYRITDNAWYGFVGMGIAFAYTSAIVNMQKLGSVRNKFAAKLRVLRRASLAAEKAAAIASNGSITAPATAAFPPSARPAGPKPKSTAKRGQPSFKRRLWSLAFRFKAFLNRNRIRTVFCSSLETQCLALFVAPLMYPILFEALLVIMILGLLQIALLPLHFHGRMRNTIKNFGMASDDTGSEDEEEEEESV